MDDLIYVCWSLRFTLAPVAHYIRLPVPEANVLEMDEIQAWAEKH